MSPCTTLPSAPLAHLPVGIGVERELFWVFCWFVWGFFIIIILVWGFFLCFVWGFFVGSFFASRDGPSHFYQIKDMA